MMFALDVAIECTDIHIERYEKINSYIFCIILYTLPLCTELGECKK